MGKRKLNKILLYITLSLLLLIFMVPTAATAENQKTFSLDVRDADVRDVLSALAKKTGTSMVLMEKPIRVTFQVEGVSPKEALELLLQKQGWTYLQDGKVIIVGSDEKLHQDFYNNMILTRFNLLYISADILEPLVSELDVPVKMLSVETNPQAVWVEGTPRALSEMKQLLTAVDRPENAEENSFNLTRYNLMYISSDVLEPLIYQLNIPVGVISLNSNPQAVWIQGETQALAKINELIVAVDRPENLDNNSLEFRDVSTQFISPKRAVDIFEEAGMPIDKYVILGSRLLVFDQKIIDNWAEVQQMINEVDNLDSIEYSVFIYDLDNTVAQDAADRLAVFGFEKVKTIPFNLAQFGRELLVVSPPYLELQVRDALRSIDRDREDINAVIAVARGENAKSAIRAKRELLSDMTGISENDMSISDNLSGDYSDPHYVLWIEETPDNIKRLQDIVNSFDG